MKLIMQFGVGLEGNCNFCYSPYLTYSFMFILIIWLYYCNQGVDIDAATRYGIKVARIPGDNTGNAASCAELSIYLILGLLRKQVC